MNMGRTMDGADERVLIYAINGRGMGHLNRTLILANALRKASPNLPIHFVVGSPLFGLVSGSGFDVTKIPDAHHPLGSMVGIHHREAYQNAVFDSLLGAIRPTRFIVDFIVNEPLFEIAERHGARVVLLYRKQRVEELSRWRKERCLRSVHSFLLPHAESELSDAEVPKEWQGRVAFLGPLSRELEQAAVRSVRARYTDERSKLCVVSIGGGGYAESYRTLRVAEATAQRLTRTATGQPVHWVIVYGPYYPHHVPDSEGNVTRLRFEPQLLELFAGADVVVCNAGYNTVSEVAVSGTPAVVIPLKTTGRDDQMERAKECEARGHALLAREEETDLIEKVRRLLDDSALVRREPLTNETTLEVGRRALSALSR